MNQPSNEESQYTLTASFGPWPFVTYRKYRRPDGIPVVWQSRHHRKGLYRGQLWKASAAEMTGLRCLWMPQQLNWWIAIGFAVGSMLFMLGSVLSLSPSLARQWSLSEAAINATFFAGSIPFTIAAWLQLFQTNNAGAFSTHHPLSQRHRVLLGWNPSNIGWLSCALQFVGTLLFNVNTFDAMLPSLDWLQQDLLIWVPDFAGSMLFLASGYLAFIETCHAHWAWTPSSLSWWVTFINLLGCVAFMISAVFALVLPHTLSFDAVTISIIFTFFGAVGFLVGSLLMLPEMVVLPKDAV